MPQILHRCMKRAEEPILGPSLHLEMCPQIVMSQILFILCGHIAFHLKPLNSKGKAKDAYSKQIYKMSSEAIWPLPKGVSTQIN